MLKLVPRGKSGIHIKKKNRGKFTASAKLHGMSVLQYASHVLNDPNATTLLKKRANFARNAARWHKDGGTLNSLWFILINENGGILIPAFGGSGKLGLLDSGLNLIRRGIEAAPKVVTKIKGMFGRTEHVLPRPALPKIIPITQNKARKISENVSNSRKAHPNATNEDIPKVAIDSKRGLEGLPKKVATARIIPILSGEAVRHSARIIPILSGEAVRHSARSTDWRSRILYGAATAGLGTAGLYGLYSHNNDLETETSDSPQFWLKNGKLNYLTDDGYEEFDPDYGYDGLILMSDGTLKDKEGHTYIPNKGFTPHKTNIFVDNARRYGFYDANEKGESNEVKRLLLELIRVGLLKKNEDDGLLGLNTMRAYELYKGIGGLRKGYNFNVDLPTSIPL